jgi:ubiquitin C-terminal hydrolase
MDAFLDLSLDIPKDTMDIRNALRNFAKEDRLEGKNKYKCEKSVGLEFSRLETRRKTDPRRA